MTYTTDLIDEGNLCGLVLVVLILVGVGQKMVQSRPNLQLWGLRIAALAFVGFTVTRIVELNAPSTSGLLSAVMVRLAAGALILGPSWIVLAIAGFLYDEHGKATRLVRSRAERRQREREQQRAQQQEHQRQQASPPTPEQEAAEREAAEQSRRALEQQKELSKRREDAIAACEVLFHLRAPDIGNRFSREQFDEFVQKYLGED